MPELFSFYKSDILGTVPYREYPIDMAVTMIKSDMAKADIENLRKATNPSTIKVIKKSLSFFTFSGTFKRREEAGLIQHSGLLTLDFDKLTDLQTSRQQLIALPFIVACFISPSGKGLKAVVRIDSTLHAETFVALEQYFLANYKLELDTSGIDVTRTCFVSYDPDIYYNPGAPAYILNEQELAFAKQQLAPVSMKPKLTETEQDRTLKIIEYVTCQIEEQGIDLTEDYQQWLYLGFALSTLGDEGRDYYHRVSQFNNMYSRKEVDYKFNNYLRKCRFTTPAKFFEIAKGAGIDIKLPKPVITAPALSNTMIIEKVPVESTKPKGDYTLLNESHGEPIHLVTSEFLIQELTQKDYPNILFSIQRFNDATASKIRAISNKVRLISRYPAADFDTCDMFVAKRFALEINLIDDEYTKHQNYIIDHYTAHQSKEKITENMLQLCDHISYYANAFERDSMASTVAKLAKTSKPTVLKEINDLIKGREEDVQELEENEDALPKWIDTNRFWTYGFDWKVGGIHDTGIYFNEYGKPKRLTNFILTPLIHVYTQDDGNRRLTEMQNGYTKTVIQLPSKAFTSMETFDNIITGEGAYFTLDGFSKSHLNKLKAYYLGEYPKCYELNTLGWQPEGFFSFSNIIYKNQLIEYNNYGYAEVEGQNFLSMGASSALDGVRAEDDIYKNDKYLKHQQSEITFTRWCELMVNVYPDHGMMGIAFAIMSVFKDILFSRNNNFPMLYAYGPIGTGKSKFAESVCNLFLHNKPMFNLNQGTDYGFFSEMGMYRNVPVGLNEFDENAIKEEWFRALKGAFDGEGRKKGAGQKNKTKTQEITACPVLIGQYLTTKDDNAVLSRTLPCKFAEKRDRTPEQVARFDELKAQEKKGISSLICDILEHREYFAQHYVERFAIISSKLKAACKKAHIQPIDRVMENYNTALTTVNLMADKIDLSLDFDAFFNHTIEEMQKLGGIMQESNSLGTFWKTIEFLLVQNLVDYGWHYKVKVDNEVRVTAGRDEQGKPMTKNVHFDEPKKLLYLRLNTVHPLYAKEIKNVTGKPGQNEQTVLSYMKDQKYYIGSSPAGAFTDSSGRTMNTSSYVFDYEAIGANLETFKEEKVDPVVTLEGQLWNDAEVVDIIGVPKLKFTLWKDESYDTPEGKVKKEIFTHCLSDLTNMGFSLKKTRKVKITGNLNERKGGQRNMAVTAIEFTEEFTPVELPEKEAEF